jgi:hypothetical protein
MATELPDIGTARRSLLRRSLRERRARNTDKDRRNRDFAKEHDYPPCLLTHAASDPPARHLQRAPINKITFQSAAARASGACVDSALTRPIRPLLGRLQKNCVRQVQQIRSLGNGDGAGAVHAITVAPD